jgi:hypothetical protein
LLGQASIRQCTQSPGASRLDAREARNGRAAITEIFASSLGWSVGR